MLVWQLDCYNTHVVNLLRLLRTGADREENDTVGSGAEVVLPADIFADPSYTVSR